MFDRLWGRQDRQHTLFSARDSHGRAPKRSTADTVLAAAAAEEGRPSHQRGHIDDAPMTPVVYVVSFEHLRLAAVTVSIFGRMTSISEPYCHSQVLWTSVAVGCLRGYALNSIVAARVAPSYTYTFSGQHQAELFRKESPYCTTGVDGLPGVSWYEGFIYIIPPAVAPLLGAMFVRLFGRRVGIMLGCAIILAGQITLASAWTLVQLYIGQALVQAASDVLFLSVAMQDIEIAPRTSRGFFLLVHILGYAFGCCAVAVVGYFVSGQNDMGWRLLFAMGTLPALAVLAVTPWLYETPHSSIERGRYAQGWEALREIRGPFYEDTYAEFMSIVRAAAAAPQGPKMYVELFRRRAYRPAICVGILISTVAALMDPLSRAYVAYQTLARGGYQISSAVLMSMLSLYGSYAVGVLLAVLLVDRVGRLPLLKASGGVAVVVVSALVAMAAVYAADFHKAVTDRTIPVPPRWPLFHLATLAILAASNGIAWSSAALVIVFESQSLAVRPAGVAMCIAVSNLAQSVLESRLLCLLRTMYYALVLCFAVVALIIAFGFVPETGRVPLEDIGGLYAKHWFWGRFMDPKPKHKKQKPAKVTAADHKHKHPPPSSSGGDEAGPSGLTTRTCSGGDDAAAQADTDPAVSAGVQAQGHSPFGLRSVQAMQDRPGSLDAGDNASAAAAEAAAAASIALAGAASRATSSAASSQALQHGRSGKKSLRFAGKRKSSHIHEVMAADPVDQLAEELEVDD